MPCCHVATPFARLQIGLESKISLEKLTSYCNAEYAMFTDETGAWGWEVMENYCMLLRVVTDFSVFYIGIMVNFFLLLLLLFALL